MAEPTGTLTYADLIADVAYYLGIHDVDGSGNVVAPADTTDLSLCKKVVNKGVRMFIHDAPNAGWRWTRPLLTVVLWPSVSAGTATVSGGAFASGVTTLTASVASFYQSMELKTIAVTGVGSFVIRSYVSATQVTVVGDASAVAAKTFSITSTGDFTLPDTFGGQVIGDITYVAGTNRGIVPGWCDEAAIRSKRSNVSFVSGTPYEFAVRTMTDSSGTGTNRRRWELMSWWSPADVLSIEFPYVLAFNEFANLTDVSPAPQAHDETIKAAVIAYAEKDVEKVVDGPMMGYYKAALQNSYRIDNRNAPRNLGYFHNYPSGPARINKDWRMGVPGPVVTYNS